MDYKIQNSELKQVLIVGTYLLSIINIPGSQSTPLPTRNMDERLSTPPFWINPGGYTIDEEYPQDEQQVSSIHLPSYLLGVIRRAETAYYKANQFKEEYAQKTRCVDAETLQEDWKYARYDWLPSFQDIPKNLGENMPSHSAFLSTLKWDTKLVDIYEQLQKYAVGLEQIVWDQEDFQGLFRQDFIDTVYNLGILLREIQDTIWVIGLEQKPDVTRDLMKAEIRSNGNATPPYNLGRLVYSGDLDLRDYLIYRDYLNALEFIIEAFTFIRAHL